MILCQEVEPEIKKISEIESAIATAIQKINGLTDKDLCKFIPSNSGGYMHHFTLRKMKARQPEELCVLLDKFIINCERPFSIAPKQRAPRGSHKSRDQVKFTRNQIDRMLNIARLAGDKEMVAVLSPKKNLKSYKRELIASIRQGRVEPELWDSYVEACNNFTQQQCRSISETMSE